MDPEIYAGLTELSAAAPASPAMPGDVTTRRATIEPMFAAALRSEPVPDGVVTSDHMVEADDGANVAVRVYRSATTTDGRRAAATAIGATGGGALYIHGGGMILGSVEVSDPLLRRYAAESGLTLAAVDYRLAPEHPGLTPVTDCYAALRWFAGAAATGEFGVNPARLAVIGESAGGGLAAGTALLARDQGGPPLAAQVLIYPMLDDTNVVPDPTFGRSVTWSWDDNRTGWDALLGTERGQEVPIYCAPARAPSLEDLPPAFIDVGELDIFRDECLDYARRLLAAGVSTELHLRRGAPHGYDVFAPRAAVSRRSWDDRVAYLTGL